MNHKFSLTCIANSSHSEVRALTHSKRVPVIILIVGIAIEVGNVNDCLRLAALGALPSARPVGFKDSFARVGTERLLVIGAAFTSTKDRGQAVWQLFLYEMRPAKYTIGRKAHTLLAPFTEDWSQPMWSLNAN